MDFVSLVCRLLSIKVESIYLFRRSRPNMKKLLSLLFALVVAFSLTMPVFAQEAPAAPEAKAEKKKAKKAKKEKKQKKEEKKEAPAQ